MYVLYDCMCAVLILMFSAIEKDAESSRVDKKVRNATYNPYTTHS